MCILQHYFSYRKYITFWDFRGVIELIKTQCTVQVRVKFVRFKMLVLRGLQHERFKGVRIRQLLWQLQKGLGGA